MTDRGRFWSDTEIQTLLALWSDDEIQRSLQGAFRKQPVWQKIAAQMEKQAFHRTPKQVSSKIKQLKKQYKESVDKLRKSGVGLDSDEEESDIYVGFKWFFELHTVMRRRAVVNPPALLDSSASGQQATSSQPDQELASLPSSPLSVHDADEAVASSPLCAQLPVASDSALQQSESFVEASTATATITTITTTTTTTTTTTSISTTVPTSPPSTGSKTRVAKKRKLTKLERAEKKTDNMLEELIKANRESEERQDKIFEQKMKRQEEYLKAQEDYLKRQERREENFMSLMQQMIGLIQPAQQLHPSLHPGSMYAMPAAVDHSYPPYPAYTLPASQNNPASNQ